MNVSTTPDQVYSFSNIETELDESKFPSRKITRIRIQAIKWIGVLVLEILSIHLTNGLSPKIGLALVISLRLTVLAT